MESDRKSEPAAQAYSMERSRRFSVGNLISSARSFGDGYIAPFFQTFGSRSGLKHVALAAIFVSLTACGVRLLYLHDKTDRMELWNPIFPTGGVFVSEAERIVESGFFPKDLSPRAHARHILHPPGYLLYLIGLFKIFGWDDRWSVMAFQAVLDSITAVLIMVFTMWVANLRVGVIAGLLIAFSPHLAYSALFVSPESLFVLPVVLSVGALYLADRTNKIRYYLLAGILVGLSCWLRANGLALSPFFALLAVALSRNRKLALKGGLVMILATACMIAPITVRNYVITGRFIPLSIGIGVILMQAVADYDFDNKYGLPKLDHEVAMKEAEWYGNPEYAKHFLRPDGIERDGARVGRTLSVIKEHPLYYLGTVLRRMDFILRYDLPPGPDDWPFHTATPVYVSKHARFSPAAPEQLSGTAVWTSGPEILTATQQMGSSLREYSINIEEGTSYLLRIEASVESGSITCIAAGGSESRDLGSVTLPDSKGESGVSYLPFASGGNTTVTVKLSGDQPGAGATTINLADARLIKIGPTRWAWTAPVRTFVRGVQRNLYLTPLMRALVLMGFIAMLITGRWRGAIWIAAGPMYFLLFQSLLHTEYRYILPVHYFLFIFPAVALYLLWSKAALVFSSARARLRP